MEIEVNKNKENRAGFKGTIIFLIILFLILLSIMFVFKIKIFNVETDNISKNKNLEKINIRAEFVLGDDYIYDNMSEGYPFYYYPLINEENVESIFDKSEIFTDVDSMEDFKKLLDVWGLIEVETSEGKKEDFIIYFFSKETDDMFVMCRVIESKNEEYFYSLYGMKFNDSEKQDSEYNIHTTLKGLVKYYEK